MTSEYYMIRCLSQPSESKTETDFSKKCLAIDQLNNNKRRFFSSDKSHKVSSNPIVLFVDQIY